MVRRLLRARGLQRRQGQDMDAGRMVPRGRWPWRASRGGYPALVPRCTSPGPHLTTFTTQSNSIFNGNECQVTRAPNGSLILNSRTGDSNRQVGAAGLVQRRRRPRTGCCPSLLLSHWPRPPSPKVSFSNDDGTTWFAPVPIVNETACEASTLTLENFPGEAGGAEVEQRLAAEPTLAGRRHPPLERRCTHAMPHVNPQEGRSW